MSTPLRELPGHQTLKAMRQLEWRFQTLKDDYQEAIDYQEPILEYHDHTFQFSRRDQLYEAEKLLHHYLSGYYTYWRQVMTVAHATNDGECKGRIENERDQHDDKTSARITRGLRMYVQKENVLPLLVYQSDHDATSPRYAINKDDIKRDGLYQPNYDHYFGEIEDVCIYTFEVINKNWQQVCSLHKSVKGLIRNHMEDELEVYEQRLQDLDNAMEDIPLSGMMEELLPTEDPIGDGLLEEKEEGPTS